MKKLFYMIALTGLVALSSCGKKDYNCTCTVIDNGIQTTYVEVLPNSTKAEAQTNCIAYEAYRAGSVQASSTKCTL